MSSDFVLAETRASLQFVGGVYVDLGGEIVELSPDLEAVTDEQHVIDREFPVVTVTHEDGSLTLTGLRSGAAGKAAYKAIRVDEDRDAFFAIMNFSQKFLGPCGYIKVKSGNLVNANGVVRLNGENPAQPGDHFETWRYGTVLPRRLNSWNNQGANGFPAPVAGQLAIIDVVAPGNMTQLRLELNKSSTTYQLEAAIDNSAVIAGITRGSMATNADPAVPVPANDLTGYRWRIVTTPSSPTGAEFYIGLFHELTF